MDLMDFLNNSRSDRDTLELSDPALIAACQQESRTRRPYKRRSEPGPVCLRAIRRCECGICPTCVENARWDRIFREKFEDPNYYKSRPTPGGSSLGWA